MLQFHVLERRCLKERVREVMTEKMGVTMETWWTGFAMECRAGAWVSTVRKMPDCYGIRGSTRVEVTSLDAC